ncbi:tetratricopeptide repeat protein [Duganella sp. HH101]|uniref:tetratricopeptide repeat protein n=1 Tax=Duganella sp. HH101 TaxID=1781066 RepID=UPI0008758128|nr:tetratricopeptide repeat protein [Duganella sp. HH101]OEZ99734.1 hypothetical protein DUGA2_51790 [Duganella sp. HH101]
MSYKLLAGLLACCAAHGAELPWDLSYQSALRDHPIAEREFMRVWPQQHPQRPIHQKLAEYAGGPIEASMLIEQPDGHAGDAIAQWFIKTRNTAQVCSFHPKRLNDECKKLDPARVETAIRDVLHMSDPWPPSGDGLVVEKDYFGPGKPLLLNYFGYVSVYVDGVSSQRPVGGDEWGERLDKSRPAGPEAGRLQLAVAKAMEGAKATAPAAAVPAPAPSAPESEELKARNALIAEVQGYLNKNDYKSLEALRKRLLDPQQRTGSGVWKLAIFYNQLRWRPQATRDMDYWTRIENEAKAWEKQFPKSSAARIYHTYVLLARGTAFRGTANYKDVPKADIERMLSATREAMGIINTLEKPMLKERDPEFYKALLQVLPYTDHYSFLGVMNTVADARKEFPNYHETYFTAAFFSTEMWASAPDAVDDIARSAMSVRTGDSEAMYARVYWYMSQMAYDDKLFENSLADWSEMKTSFDTLVDRYPDPWNLNAYAYFACQAGDYATMAGLLNRIGERRVYTSWGKRGARAYDDCAAHAGDDTSRYLSDLREMVKKRQTRVFYRYINYAAQTRKDGKYGESMRILRKAEELNRVLFSKPSMMVQYHLGLTFNATKRYDEAVQALSLGLQSQPSYAPAYFQRGLAYEALGRREEARGQFETAAGRMPAEITSKEPAQREAEEQERRTMSAKFREYGISAPF